MSADLPKDDRAFIDEAVGGLAAYLEAHATCKHCLDMGGTLHPVPGRVAPDIKPCPHCAAGARLAADLAGLTAPPENSAD